MIVLILIGLTVELPSITGQIRRDREDELIHRGAQYARAIKRFYKRNGTYPTSVDQLLNTNRVRYLRQKYKDPVTGNDFRLLRQSDAVLLVGSAVFTNQQGAAQATGSAATSSANSSPNAAALAAAAQAAAGGAASATFGNVSGSASTANTGGTTAAASSDAATTTTTSAGSGTATATTTTSSSTPSSTSSGSSSSSGTSTTSSSPFTSISGSSTSPTFGGGPIVGVASTSPLQSFHVFNKKDHYKDWAFIYDPNQDLVVSATSIGNLITGPYNGPPKFGTSGVPGAVPVGQMQSGTTSSGSSGSGTFGSSTTTTSPFGSSPFGQR